ncbi:MAG TPA: hypothetical protein VKG23_13615 [Thermoanaerobaculia bacterium]|nr:hypothetical protein [Thermoanaerobaculia bacterium]
MRVRPPAALVLAIAACACRYEHSRPIIVSGKNFPCRSAIGLEGEPTPAEVIAMIGEPLERTPAGDRETFRYSVRGTYGDRVRLFGIIPVSRPHYSWSCDVQLEFRSGHLYAITHTREDIGPDGTDRDGPSTRIVGPPKT